MASGNEKKKGLVRRGLDCLNQFGWKYTLYVIRTGEYRRDEDDVYTVAESKAWSGTQARKDVVLSSASHSIYESWIQENELRRYSDLAVKPLFSVVIPVYNVKDDQLTACIESVRGQSYDNWELILVDDHSTWESVRMVLRRYREDKRIKVIFREENGNISRATNDGIAAAQGDFIAFADCDDVLAPDALFEMARALNEHPEYDFIYSDEDKLSEDGLMRHDPFFKPDWSPDTFLSMMYTNHLAVYRTELVRKTGGLRPEFDGAQDYDFTLRFMELTDNSRVGHIAKVLYYWRERAESAATGAEAKPYALRANERAKLEALSRRGIRGRTEFVADMNQYRVVYDCGLTSSSGSSSNEDEPFGSSHNAETPLGNKYDDVPLVSIIIPSKDNVEYLTRCITSIKEHTDYPRYEIILVDNGSSEENQKKIQVLTKCHDVRYFYEKMEFNFSRMCNIGADHAEGDYLLFLNDDIEIIQDDWLARMTGQAMQDHIGAVGAKLLYPDSTLIQHDGVINRRNGPTHILQRLDDRNIFYYGRNRLEYDCIAVTGACLMVSAENYRKVGRMDEELHVTYNDVDLCLNLFAQGLYNVVRNDVVLWHHESVSRGLDTMSYEKLSRLLEEQEHMWNKHPEYRTGLDPFYSRHFGEDTNDFTMHKWNMAENVTAVVNMAAGRSEDEVVTSATAGPDKSEDDIFTAGSGRSEDKTVTTAQDRSGRSSGKKGTVSSGMLAHFFKNNQLACSLDEVSFGENYTLFYGYMYLKSRLPLPVYLERYLMLTDEDGGQLLVKLNRQTRLDIHAHKVLKDSLVGFMVRVPDHLLDRTRTSYRVSLLLKSAGNAYTICAETDAVVPRKKEDYCDGVHLELHFPSVLGHGMTLVSYDRDEQGTLHISGKFDGEHKAPNLWNCHIVVNE